MRVIGVGPIALIFNRFGLTIGMVEICMPYMIMALLAGFGRLDGALDEPAASLGANKLSVLFCVVLPLALPGILLGASWSSSSL